MEDASYLQNADLVYDILHAMPCHAMTLLYKWSLWGISSYSQGNENQTKTIKKERPQEGQHMCEEELATVVVSIQGLKPSLVALFTR